MKVLIFDFDGVIIDSWDYFKGIVKEMGIYVSDEDLKAHHDGNVYEKPKIPFTEETANIFFNIYEDKVQNNSSFFTNDEIKILANKYNLFIISSNLKTIISKFLKNHKLNYFDEVLGMEFEKSKIKKFEYLQKKYNLKTEDIFFVTDTLGDILEANKLDIKTIAVDYGFHDRERLKKGNPFKIVSNFDEICEVISN